LRNVTATSAANNFATGFGYYAAFEDAMTSVLAAIDENEVTIVNIVPDLYAVAAQRTVTLRIDVATLSDEASVVAYLQGYSRWIEAFQNFGLAFTHVAIS